MINLTIGMPVFNDIAFIEQSLKSILEQSHRQFTLIISDDGSTDGSEAICRKYAAQDERIVYIRQPKNLGISKNMEFLLQQATTPYFMWAADDDLWHENFCKLLIQELEQHPLAVSAFCKYDQIDEEGNKIDETLDFDYSALTPFARLTKLLKNSDDGFGYGIFRTEKIKEVRFPVWWWPNRKSAYNNIYPTLCFYLAKGQYVYYHKEALFFKREKTSANTNHLIAGRGNAIKETLSYMMRRMNLVIFSTRLIVKAGGLSLSIRVFPLLFNKWFMKSSWQQITLASRSFWQNKIVKK